MTVCICSDGYPSPGLPYSAFIQVLAREMGRQGHKVFVVAPQSLTNHFFRNGKLAPRKFKDEVSVNGLTKTIAVYRPYSITFGEGRLGWLTPKFNRWATERLIKQEHLEPDFFYAHFWANGYNAERVARKNKKPLFVATGEDKINITDFLSEKDIFRLNNGVSGVICVSTKNKEESIRRSLTTSDKCVVIPNAYDPNDFHQLNRLHERNIHGFPDSSFIVSFCGRFNKRKGAMRVAEAIRLLHDDDIKSIFIGTPADNEYEQPECDGVLFKGGLPHDQINSYLNCSDVFVLPSLAEGCPNSVIEAMACGLPIISSDLPFNYDILNNENSILVNPEDVNAIASAIKQLKDDETQRERLAKNSLDKAKELTIKERVDKILFFIQKRCNQNV